jgi:hypothetical protein
LSFCVTTGFLLLLVSACGFCRLRSAAVLLAWMGLPPAFLTALRTLLHSVLRTWVLRMRRHLRMHLRRFCTVSCVLGSALHHTAA